MLSIEASIPNPRELVVIINYRAVMNDCASILARNNRSPITIGIA
jgi:hypothetical protein